jgi:hypothetical protein
MKAWTSYPTDTRHESVCWPEQWLPEDLGDNVRILSLSYDANVLGAHDHVSEIGKNLIQSLVRSYRNLWVAPIVLVGYSFGGLVVKSLIVEVHRRIHQNSKNPLEQKVNESCKNFSKYLKGIVFYGVPHSGGPQKLLEYIVSKCQEKNVLFEKRTAQSSLLKNLESFNRQMRELSVDFESSISTDLITFGFGEGKPLDEKWGVLVPYASACELTRHNNYKIEDANHLTICKPPAKDHQGYSMLLEVLKTCLEVPGNSTSNDHVVLLAKFESTMLTKLMPSTYGDTYRSIAIGFKNYTTYNFQNTEVYFENGTSDFNMPFQIGPKHVGIWGARKSNGVPSGSSGTFSYYIKEKNKTLYVMWSVPLNTIVYENWWSATVVDGEQQANNHTHNAMYYGTSGMPNPLRSGGWKCRNINSFSLNGCMSTNGQATLELDVKSL